MTIWVSPCRHLPAAWTKQIMLKFTHGLAFVQLKSILPQPLGLSSFFLLNDESQLCTSFFSIIRVYIQIQWSSPDHNQNQGEGYTGGVHVCVCVCVCVCVRARAHAYVCVRERATEREIRLFIFETYCSLLVKHVFHSFPIACVPLSICTDWSSFHRTWLSQTAKINQTSRLILHYWNFLWTLQHILIIKQPQIIIF